MPQRQDPNFIAPDNETVKSYVAGLPVRNDQFAQIVLKASAEQWMRRQILNGRLDGGNRIESHLRILLVQELEGALDVTQGALRIG